jgi:hypothetical protein
MEIAELNPLFSELLATNSGPGYVISVVGASPDLSAIDVELRLLSERTYCCAEPGCHLPRDHHRLRQLAANQGIALPESLVVRWKVRVERGAKVQSLALVGLEVSSEEYVYEVTGGVAGVDQREPPDPVTFDVSLR